MSVNKLIISDSFIEFSGFDLLKQQITFCFYPGGIVILPEWKLRKQNFYYESTLNNERRIYDKFLIDLLGKRGITQEEQFVKLSDHYTELKPHKN